MIFTFISMISLLATISQPVRHHTNSETGTIFDENFISQPYFVDKTLMLREFFKNGDGPDYNYITYPPKFGKTSIIEMIKSFAQIEVDERHHVCLNWTQTKAYHLFKNLKIARHPDVLEKHMASYAVIHFDLKVDIEDPINDFNVVMALNEAVRKCYEEYRWIVKIARNLVRNVYTSDSIMGKALKGELDQVELRESILFLAQLLRDFFNAKVLLLIDNYDYFPNQAFVSGRKHIDRYRKIVNYVIKKSFTYGNLQISHAIIFGCSSLNYNFSSYNYPGVGHYELADYMFLADDRFGAYMGFNEYDVNTLCQRYQCTEEESYRLKMWYNGYLTRKLNLCHEENNKVHWLDVQTFGSEQRSIYNPYSITQYFFRRSSSNSNDSFQDYWSQTQDQQFIYNFLRVPEFRNKFVELFKYGGIEMPFDRDKIPKHFHQFISMEPHDDEIIELEDSENLLVGFCFDLGYLSYSKDLFHVAKIPNHEIQRALPRILVEFYRKRSMPIDEISDCFDQIISASMWNDTTDAALKTQQVISKTFRMISKPSYYKRLTTGKNTRSESFHQELLPKGMEFHNIIFTAALYTSLKRSEIVVNVTQIGDYRERDDILVHDRGRNDALIIRIRNQTDMEKSIPTVFRRALKPKKNIVKIKFLIIKIDRKSQVETLVQLFN